MKPAFPTSTITAAVIFSFASIALSQTSSPTSGNENDAVRVNVTINADGSRTVYEFDQPHHQATATTTEPDGKLRGKIRYQLDDAGRFTSGLVYGADEKLRFKSIYKYDAAGRIQEETQLGNDDTVRAKIVYSYDQTGKQTGYSIFDASGKLIGRTPSPTPTAKAGKKR